MFYILFAFKHFVVEKVNSITLQAACLHTVSSAQQTTFPVQGPHETCRSYSTNSKVGEFSGGISTIFATECILDVKVRVAKHTATCLKMKVKEF